MATISRNIGNFFDKSGSCSRRIGQYTGPNPYVTGGDSFTPGEVALGRIDILLFEEPSNGVVQKAILYDYTNQKVKWFDMAGTETANGTDLSAYTARFEAIGI